MKAEGRKSGRKATDDGQAELFPAAPDAPGPKGGTNAGAVTGAKGPPETLPAGDREDAFETLLARCAPVRAGGREAAWLKERRVFRKTWLAQGLRVVADYRAVADALLSRFPLGHLAAWGLFNREGHLRFYRHTLVAPWMDGTRARHLQAFAIDDEAKPKVLSTTGTPPLPYNAALLNGVPGRLYLCAGVPSTLEFLEGGFPAVGTDGDGILRAAWLPRFRGKSVYVAFGHDAEGEAAAAKALTLLADAGVEAHRLHAPGHADAEGR